MSFTRFAILFLFAIFLAILLNALFFRKSENGCSKCDVVLVTLDSWRYEDFDKLKMPKGGVFFKNAIVNSTWTLPSYASIYTSDYPAKQAVWLPSDKLNPDSENFVSKLKSLGYKTNAYSVGPFFQKEWGFESGFDKFLNISNTDELKKAWTTDLNANSANSQPDFYWIRLGSRELVLDYENNIDKTLTGVQDLLSQIVDDKNTEIVVVGAFGKLSEKPSLDSIKVPMFFYSPKTSNINTKDVFEVKDVSKLILGEAEFLKNRNSKNSLVALTSVTESEKLVREIYGKGKDLEVKPVVRNKEWNQPYFSSSISNNWHLIKDLSGEYFLYDLQSDPDEKNNLFSSWNSLAGEKRAHAIDVIRSIGGDVPELCGIYCGSDEFFK